VIVKTLRWKVGAFGRLVDYVGKNLVAYVGKEGGHSEMLLHNLRPTRDLDDIARQFAENDTYRKRRKNGVAMYHEIISFHVRDRESITSGVLEDITREYLRLRAPRALAFACPHYDREHVHVHIAISGTEFRRSKTLRMDNRAFMRLRRQIERYQIDRYPELSHSIVYLPGREKDLARAQGEPDALCCYDRAEDLTSFLDCVSDSGVANEPDERNPGGEPAEIDHTRLLDLELRVRELNALRRLQIVSDILKIPPEPAVDDLIERYERFVENVGPAGGAEVGRRVDELENARAVDRDPENELER